MKKSLSAQLSVTVVSLILGLALAAQFKNVQRVGGSVSLQRTQELTRQVQKLEQENEALEARIQEYERRIKEFENAVQSEDQSNRLIYEELERTRMLAGLVDVQGPGVVVTVNVKHVNEWGQDAIVQNVRYDDLLKLVNELNAAGAEAIAINDERIIATTEIRNAGDYIVINTNRYSSPFEIKAIGNPDTLEAALKLLGGVADDLGVYLQINIKRVDNIRIPKYRGTFQYKFAKPVQDTNARS
ncbi:MAG: DUF881 domain-containing protein [Caldicoprobacter oshimai]|uniref:Uncharacterized conserved protein YlxW, UPF0749 family n=1 Tax=Caldicoprobacter faecalis TaxID=937334 RepID=A0A1I5XM46_9FIRM|nr:DUF881 domain-containing protein [Caldicoprobacter faecalis]PZN11580.1 MAG: DUF881 domain-containing protein [Caldicoprobacter oshimai]SFQ33045.1 Uncharacterized conserved protein YlxW, UPF0749 family [Caldicoprobacter faecalis]